MDQSSGITWKEAAGDIRPGVKTEVCKFDFNGRRYIALRAAGSSDVLRLSKRERTNRSGVQYWPLNLSGKAARVVLDFMRRQMAGA